MKELIAIFLGGGFGAVARFGVGRLSLALFPNALPIGTLISNVLSCIILGLAVVYISREQLNGFWIPFVVIGFCGGFSTFSTFSFETMRLINQQKYIWAGLNIGISVVLCVVILTIISKYIST